MACLIFSIYLQDSFSWFSNIFWQQQFHANFTCFMAPLWWYTFGNSFFWFSFKVWWLLKYRCASDYYNSRCNLFFFYHYLKFFISLIVVDCNFIESLISETLINHWAHNTNLFWTLLSSLLFMSFRIYQLSSGIPRWFGNLILKMACTSSSSNFLMIHTTHGAGSFEKYFCCSINTSSFW